MLTYCNKMMIISFTYCNDIHRKHKHHHHKKHHHHHKHHHSHRHRHSRSRSASPPRNRNSQAALEEVLASESTAAEKLRRLHLEGLSNLAAPNPIPPPAQSSTMPPSPPSRRSTPKSRISSVPSNRVLKLHID